MEHEHCHTGHSFRSLCALPGRIGRLFYGEHSEHSECRDIEKELVPYCQGDLSRELNARVEEHVRRCTRCREHLQDIRGLSLLLGERAGTVYAVNIWPRLREDLRSAEGAGRVPRWILVPTLNVIVAGILISHFSMRQQPVLPVQDEEVVQNLEFLEDYEVWDSMEALDALEHEPDQ